MNGSTTRLVAALVAVNDASLDSVIDRARAEHYHDFDSTIEMPTLALVLDLEREVRRMNPRSASAVRSLIRRVKGGEFDAPLAEAREWLASSEGQAAVEDLGPSAARYLGVVAPEDTL